jgi:hypothetical protein
MLEWTIGQLARVGMQPPRCDIMKVRLLFRAVQTGYRLTLHKRSV